MVPSWTVLPVHPRTTCRWASGLILSAALLLSGTSLAQPSDEEKAAARALATQGADALKSGRYAEVLDLVGRAEAIVHAPTHLLMLARANVGLGKLVAAQEAFLKLLREDLPATAPAAFKNAQATARDELAAIEPRIAQLRIVADGAPQKRATVKLDDVVVPPALLGVFRPVDPGHHVITVFPASGAPIKTPVDLREAEKKDVKLAVPDAPAPTGVPLNPVDNPDAGKQPPPSQDQNPQVPDQPRGFMTPLRGAGIGVAVVGVGAAAAGAAFLALGFSAQSTGDANFAKFCPCTSAKDPKFVNNVQSYDQTAARDKTIGVIALPIGVAALGTGVALLVAGKPKAAASHGKGSVAPWFAGTSGGLRGEF